ncbi:hypothetical protein BGP77_11675, partial [Saccharospirillum sp. MSK14-1]|uniref:acyltransferase family protein n=1 Tax=Saccharospirillum sp. MSK14-1 TaxID=1897632 RepID=UPI000D48373F
MNISKINELTSLRGIAAISIVIHHFFLSISPDLGVRVTGLTNYVSQSYLWVDMFFLLSGFVLTIRYHNRLTLQPYDIKNFVLARFARIYPLHFVILVLFLIIEVVKYQNNGEFLNSPNSFPDLMRNLFLLQGIQFDYLHTSWNHPSWSISIEWFSYLLFPIILIIASKNHFTISLTLTVCSILFIYIVSNITEYELDVTGILGLVRCISEMVIGSILAIIIHRMSLKLRSLISHPGVTLCVVIALFTGMHFDWSDLIIVLIMATLIAILGCSG